MGTRFTFVVTKNKRMFAPRSPLLSIFFIVGINYKKADADLRGNYAINKDQYASLFDLAPGYNISEFFVLSTCNRTEIYGFAENAGKLADLVCTQTEGDRESFAKLAYIRQGQEAVEHLFNVAAGLDSQILGDYEIVGQIKVAVKTAKNAGFLHCFMERLINTVLQASKRIKSETELSGGTVSVAFAAMQYLKEKIVNARDKKILLLGTGKIGKNTCKNLVDYLGAKNITLINRTEETAVALACELGLKSASLTALGEEIDKADIIFVATNSDSPIILSSHLRNRQDKVIIDLSIPYNVEISARQLPNVTLVNVDDLSKIKDETLQKRMGEVPKAKAVISKHIAEFIEWYQMRRHVPVLIAIKSKLEEIQHSELYTCKVQSIQHETASKYTEKKIQRIINGMAIKMREQNRQGCTYIEAINEYIATGTI